jgi:hypothetical protein
MLPISAIVGISSVGYLLDQVFRGKEFEENNEGSEIPVENINGCAEQYPWNFLQNQDDYAFHNKKENFEDYNFIPNNKMSSDSRGPINQFGPLHKEPSPLTSNSINVPSEINAVNNAGNPPPNYLINATERPVDDFTFNNMVPFFRGAGTKQDMRGTGVSQANVLSEDYNLGNDNKTSYNTTISTFTGCDDTFFHKREAPSLFSPLEQKDRNTIPGDDAAAQRPLLDRYTTSLLTRNDETPFESLMVGPGIAIDADLPNDGQGFNSGLSTQVKPNNVNAYRLTQLPGRVSGAKYQISNLPEALPGIGPSFESFQNSKSNNHKNSSIYDSKGNINTEKLINEGSMYGVPLKKEDLSFTLDRRPLTGTPGVTQAPMNYSNVIFPSGTYKREGTNVSFGQSVKIS